MEAQCSLIIKCTLFVKQIQIGTVPIVLGSPFIVSMFMSGLLLELGMYAWVFPLCTISGLFFYIHFCVCFALPWQVANHPGSMDPPPSYAAGELQRSHHSSGWRCALGVPGRWCSRPSAVLGSAWSFCPDVSAPLRQSHIYGHKWNPPYSCNFPKWQRSVSLCGLKHSRCCQFLCACTRVLAAPSDTATQGGTPALVSREACLCSLLRPRCPTTSSALANTRWDSGSPISVSPWQPLRLAQWDFAYSKCWTKGLWELRVHSK